MPSWPLCAPQLRSCSCCACCPRIRPVFWGGPPRLRLWRARRCHSCSPQPPPWVAHALQAALKRLGLPAGPSYISALLDQYDLDGTRSIEFEEFRRWGALRRRACRVPSPPQQAALPTRCPCASLLLPG